MTTARRILTRDQTRREINPEWISKGLCFAQVNSAYDYFNGDPSTPAGTLGAITRYGPAYANGGVKYDANNDVAPYTLICGISWTAYSNYSVAGRGYYVAAGNNSNIGFGYWVDGQLSYLNYNDDRAGVFPLEAATLPYNRVWAATGIISNYGEQLIFRNGVYFATKASPHVYIPNPLRAFSNGANATGTNTPFILWFTQQLSAADIAFLSAYPEAVYLPIRNTLWSLESGAAPTFKPWYAPQRSRGIGIGMR